MAPVADVSCEFLHNVDKHIIVLNQLVNQVVLGTEPHVGDLLEDLGQAFLCRHSLVWGPKGNEPGNRVVDARVIGLVQTGQSVRLRSGKYISKNPNLAIHAYQNPSYPLSNEPP